MSFSPDQLVRALSVPLNNAVSQWPLVTAALAAHNIDDQATEIAAAATISVETPAFWPIAEYGGSSAWYAPYYGRGLIQLTLKENYAHYGAALGVDLVDNPDLALRDDISAKVLGLYFAEHGIHDLANAGDWVGVRRAVNGGDNGLQAFLVAVKALQAQPWGNADPAKGSTWHVVTRTDLHQDHTLASKLAIDATHHPVTLPVGTTVTATGQNTPHWSEVTINGSSVHGWILRTCLR